MLTDIKMQCSTALTGFNLSQLNLSRNLFILETFVSHALHLNLIFTESS